MKFIVMAGGLGTKLWPVSTQSRPKQFRRLIGEKTLVQLNVEALLEKYKPEDIYIATIPEFIKYVEEQLPQIPKENHIIEPMFRGTGPASGYAMLHVAQKHPDEVVMFYVQPVVVRSPNSKYLEMIEEMEKLVELNGQLSTGAKFPTYVETGSDLIELGEKIKGTNGLEVYKTKSWVDVVNKRIDYKKVKSIVEEKKHIVHCNHYTWRPKEFFQAYKKMKPDWYKTLMKIKTLLDEKATFDEISKTYSKFETGRTEVVTKPLFSAGKVNVVILPFNWAHITTWRDIEEYTQKSKFQENTPLKIELDSKNNFVFGDKGKLVGLIGVNDLVIVQTEEALLIVKKDEISKVKELNDIISAKFPDYK